MSSLQQTIERGTPVEITTAYGVQMRMVALGSPFKGKDFPVVLICTEDEFQRVSREGGEADGQLWPLDALTPLELV